MRIKFRNIKRDENGVIQSGSATLVQYKYSPNPNGNRLGNHTKTEVIEPLGKVLWMDETDKSCGIFNSSDRGVVFYDLKTDQFLPVDPQDPRLAGTKFHPEAVRIHTNFGASFLFFAELAKTPILIALKETFGDNEQLHQKALAHLAHDCLKNGSSIKCGEFLKESVLSNLLTAIPVSELDCDTSYYKALADDNLKVKFFTVLIREMRKVIPDFGRAAYVDSTPLPGDAKDNPFNALCSHGTDGAVIQSRLALVLDINTGIPVWFEVFPSNVLDNCTLESIGRDIEASMHIKIDMYDVDAGYSRESLFDDFNVNKNTYVDEEGIIRDHTLLLRMPEKNGYPKDDAYVECKKYFHNGRYMFDYENHTYFGKRIEHDVFENPEHLFVYVDTDRATKLLRKWRTEDPAHQKEWDSLTDLQQDWYQVKFGFFILVGNKDQTAQEALTEYFGRTDIEGFFRDGKTYLKILPLAKWSKEAVLGKIFHDVIETVCYRTFRKQIASTGRSMSSLLVTMNSWECFRKTDDILELKTPQVEVREILEALGYPVPGHMDLNDLRQVIFEGTPMNLEPVTVKTGTSSKKIAPQLAPEEKIDLKERMHVEKVKADAGKKMTTAVGRAEKKLQNTEKRAEEVLDAAKARAKKQLDKAGTGAKREKTREKARERAQATYQQAVARAEARCTQTKADARKRYEQVIAEAREVYDQTVTAAMADKNQPNPAQTDQCGDRSA